MQDTLSEGTACATQLAPSAVTASAVGGSANRSVVGRVSPTTGPCDAPRLNAALVRLVDLKAALLAEARAHGPDGSRMRSPQQARCSLGARATSSVDGWVSMALRLDVVEAAGASFGWHVNDSKQHVG